MAPLICAVMSKSPPDARATSTDASAPDHVAGNKFRHYAVGDAMQLVAVSVADQQNQRECDPQQRRGEGLCKTLTEHDQHGAADKHQQHGPINQRGEIAGGQPADIAFAMARNENDESNREADQQNRQQALTHRYHPLSPVIVLQGVHVRR